MIKLCKYTLLLCLIFYQTAYAEFDFNLSGYIFALPIYQRLDNSVSLFTFDNNINKDIYIGISKLRLKPIINLWDNARLEAATETLIEISKFKNPLFADNEYYSRQALDADFTILSQGDINITQSIDRLFFKQTFDDFELTFGRQRVNWGVGRIWQPTDLLHPVNPANYAKIEKTGADALSVKYFIGNFSDVELVVNFRNTFKDNNYGIRIRTNVSPFDFSGIFGYFGNDPIIGFDVTGNLFDAGIRAEGIYISKDSDNQPGFIRLIAGADYQFSKNLYGLVEFQYNGEGTSCKYCYDLSKLIRGKVINLGMYYLALMLNYQIHPLITITGNYMQNTNDFSGYFQTMLNCNAGDNLIISCGGMLPFGYKFSEYRYYPKSFYLITQLFF